MPPSAPLKSKTDEKDIELLDYSSAINQLNVTAKKELEETRNQINTANYQLAMLRDKIIKDSNDLESFKRSEKLKFINEFTKRQNDIIAKQNQINMEVQQQERITADLRTQQTRFEGLRTEQIKLKEDLVKLEGRKIEIEDSAKQVEARRSEVLSTQNQATMALAKSSEESEKTRQDNIRLVSLNDELNKREKKLEEDIKNSKDLKDFVEPKIRAIREEQEALDRAKYENTELISKLQQTILEEKILLQSVMDRKLAVERSESELLSKKEEFSRQQLLSNGIVSK